MKIKDGYILKHAAGSNIIVPIACNSDMSKIMTLSDGGALLFEKLADGCTLSDLTAALCSEYDVDTKQAESDAQEFLLSLRNAGLLDE